MSQAHPFETDLDRTGANFVPLTPVSFLLRAARGIAGKTAVIDGERQFTYQQLFERAKRLASALGKRGVRRLDTVAIIASNIAEMIEAHFAVPMLGAVLNPINTRLDAASIAFSLNHGQAKVFIVDAEHARVAKEALALVRHPVDVIDIDVPGQPPTPIGNIGYEALPAIPLSPWSSRQTSGSPCACSTPPAPPEIQKGPYTVTAAPICRPWAMP
jgi:fatty-acyl-CoA synthase